MRRAILLVGYIRQKRYVSSLIKFLIPTREKNSVIALAVDHLTAPQNKVQTTGFRHILGKQSPNTDGHRQRKSFSKVADAMPAETGWKGQPV